MRVLAVDVGLLTSGYVLCQVENLNIDLIKEEEIKPNPRYGLGRRLKFIYDALEKEASLYPLGAIVAEKLYSHHRHPATLGILAQVRGVVVLLASQKNIEFFEYSPTRARKSFLGKGSAGSQRVKKMAENLTGRSFKSEHTADAFSLVTAFSHSQKLNRILKEVL